VNLAVHCAGKDGFYKTVIRNLDSIRNMHEIFSCTEEDLLEFPLEFNCSKLLGSVLLT
jgi:hypothetical protein